MQMSLLRIHSQTKDESCVYCYHVKRVEVLCGGACHPVYVQRDREGDTHRLLGGSLRDR